MVPYTQGGGGQGKWGTGRPSMRVCGRIGFSVCWNAGSEEGPTTDPVLIKVQQDFMAASSHMQQAGLSPTFFATPQNTLSSEPPFVTARSLSRISVIFSGKSHRSDWRLIVCGAGKGRHCHILALDLSAVPCLC